MELGGSQDDDDAGETKADDGSAGSGSVAPAKGRKRKVKDKDAEEFGSDDCSDESDDTGAGGKPKKGKRAAPKAKKAAKLEVKPEKSAKAGKIPSKQAKAEDAEDDDAVTGNVSSSRSLSCVALTCVCVQHTWTKDESVYVCNVLHVLKFGNPTSKTTKFWDGVVAHMMANKKKDDDELVCPDALLAYGKSDKLKKDFKTKLQNHVNNSLIGKYRVRTFRLRLYSALWCAVRRRPSERARRRERTPRPASLHCGTKSSTPVAVRTPPSWRFLI